MKTYLITGGASGIGLALSLDVHALGHQAVVLDQHARPEGLPVSVKYYRCDLSNIEQLKHTLNAIQSEGFMFDVLVHNAATSKGGVLSATYDDFNHVMAVNVSAPFYLTQQLLPQLKHQASVVFIASTRAFQAQQDNEAYSASKGAVISLMQALAVSLGGRVRVNAITPGWIDTTQQEMSKADREQHPAKRVGTPQDIIQAIYFLSDPKQSFIQGANLVIDGGMTKQMIYHADEGWRYDPNPGLLED